MKLSQRHLLSAHTNTFHSYHAIVYKSICAACYRKHQMHKTKTDHSKIVYEPFLSWSSKVKATISQDKFNSHFDYFNIVAKYAKAHVHNWLFGINRKLIVLKKRCVTKYFYVQRPVLKRHQKRRSWSSLIDKALY